jgi:hypothetical protein
MNKKKSIIVLIAVYGGVCGFFSAGGVYFLQLHFLFYKGG